MSLANSYNVIAFSDYPKINNSWEKAKSDILIQPDSSWHYVNDVWKEVQLLKPTACADLGAQMAIWLRELDAVVFEQFIQSYKTYLEETDNHFGLGLYAQIYGQYFLMKGDLNQCIQTYNYGIDQAKLAGDSNTLAGINLGLFPAYVMKGEDEKAMQSSKAAERIFKSEKDTAKLVNLYSNEGWYYTNKGMFHSAHRVFAQAVWLSNMANLKTTAAYRAKIHLGVSEMQMGEYTSALSYFEAIDQELISDPEKHKLSRKTCLINLAECYIQLNNYHRADSVIGALKEVLPPDFQSQLHFLLLDANLLIHKGNQPGAKLLLESCDSLIQTKGSIYTEIDLLEKHLAYANKFNESIIPSYLLLDYQKKATSDNDIHSLYVIHALIARNAFQQDNSTVAYKNMLIADSLISEYQREIKWNNLADFTALKNQEALQNKLKIAQEKGASVQKTNKALYAFASVLGLLLLSLLYTLRLRKKNSEKESEIAKQKIDRFEREAQSLAILKNELEELKGKTTGKTIHASILLKQVKKHIELIDESIDLSAPQQEHMKKELSELKSNLQSLSSADTVQKERDLLNEVISSNQSLSNAIQNIWEKSNEKERAVILLVASGLTSKEIASYLNMSEGYIENIRSKARKNLKIPQGVKLNDFLAKIKANIK